VYTKNTIFCLCVHKYRFQNNCAFYLCTQNYICVHKNCIFADWCTQMPLSKQLRVLFVYTKLYLCTQKQKEFCFVAGLGGAVRTTVLSQWASLPFLPTPSYRILHLRRDRAAPVHTLPQSPAYTFPLPHLY
jgi:hypothetical protein